LHPVEEFERFVELQERFGLGAREIAARTGKSVQFVQGRLRLARLSPKVRAAWREGKLTAEQARAFSATESQEAQDAFLEESSIDLNDSARWIVRELSGNDVSTSDKRAIFVGLDAYVAAGGRLDEQLFEDESFILDAPVLDQLAREKLEREAERIARDEGWGWFETSYGEAKLWRDFNHVERFDLTSEEQARLDEIENLAAEAEEADDASLIAALDREVIDIQNRGRLRAMPKEERAALGIYVAVGGEGELEITYALKQLRQEPEQSEDAEAGDPEPGRGSKKAKDQTQPPLQASEPIGKSTRALLDEAATLALSDACARNPRLAMLYAVASLGCGYAASMLHLSGATRPGFEPENPLLAEIRHERFEKALAICARHELADPTTLPVAFATLIGGHVSTQRASDFETVRITLGVASRFCDIAGDLRLHMDFEAYFKAEPRDAAIEAIRAMDGAGAASDAGKLKKPELAKRAAILAQDRGWLPEAFAAALVGESGEQLRREPDTRSTAEAMRDAIEEDEANKSADPATDAFDEKIAMAAADYPALAEFLRTKVFFGNSALDAGRVKASELYEAYSAFSQRAQRKAASLSEFGGVIASIGIEKKRLKTGVHYLNIALRSALAAA
jgi:ParB family chromosome partitioning protein